MTAAASSLASIPQTLAQAARWTRFTAAVGFAALSLCLLSEVALEAFPLGEATSPAAPRRVGTDAAGRPVPTAEAPPIAAEIPSAQPFATPTFRQILVDLGPPRSEVFVDGRRVGKTPFVGQVRCRPGREISIHVIPERGLPLEEKRVCPP